MTLNDMNVDNELTLDYTPLMKGRFRFAHLRRDRHLSKVMTELLARGVDIPVGTEGKIRELIKLLKRHEGDDYSFRPWTGIDNFQRRASVDDSNNVALLV